MLDAVPASTFAWARWTKQKVTKQLISSKKSRFITGANLIYATSPQKNWNESSITKFSLLCASLPQRVGAGGL
jgi:hypothetical protein